MKKFLGSIALCGIVLFGITSCGDDNNLNFGDPQSPTQQFINSLNLEGAFVDDGRFSIGTVYEFQKDGRVTQLCVKVPNDGTYRVDLWDLSDSTIVAAVNIVADSGSLVCIDITAVAVSAGNRMGITLQTFDYYIFNDGVNVIYPATFGDVTIVGYGLIFEPIGIMFPTTFFDDHLSGVVDLVFEPMLD